MPLRLSPPRSSRVALVLALGAGLLVASPAALHAQGPGPAYDVAQAATRDPLMPGRPIPVELGRGEVAFFRLPDGAGDLTAFTRRLEGETDTVLALVDFRGRVLDEDDDGAEGLASRLDIGGDQAGPLFLRLSLLNRNGGRFELVLESAVPAAGGAARTLAEAATRPALEVNQPVQLQLRSRQEAWFRLPASREDLLVVTRRLEGGTDTVLALVDANGRDIAEDDDGGSHEPLASQIEVPAGQRRPAFVRARSIAGSGRFELVVTPDTTPPGPAFPASLRAAADAPALEVGRAVPLVLRRGQTAYFRLPDGNISVLTRNLGSGTDTVLTLLDANGEEMAEDDDGGGGLASRLDVSASDARPLFVRASLLGDRSGSFEIAVEADAAGPVFPLSLDQARGAPALERGVPVSLRLRRGQSAFFLLPPGAHVVLTRNLRDGTDTVLEILDETGRVLAEDDDGGGGLASRLAVPADRKGALFVRAGVFGDGAGTFDLVLQPPGGGR